MEFFQRTEALYNKKEAFYPKDDAADAAEKKTEFIPKGPFPRERGQNRQGTITRRLFVRNGATDV